PLLQPLHGHRGGFAGSDERAGNDRIQGVGAAPWRRHRRPRRGGTHAALAVGEVRGVPSGRQGGEEGRGHGARVELFGYARGPFTDARQAKPGLFQRAHRGMLFLDEIGMLAPALQAKLLKVLEDGVVRRLGATRAEPVDVWIVSATNEDLAEAMRA